MPKVRSVARRLYRDARTLARNSACLALSDWKQIRSKGRLDATGKDRLLDYPAVVEELGAPTFPRSKVRISLVGASRCLGNPNHRLAAFLDSVVLNAKDAASVEVLVAIDPDDDVSHFLGLKNLYKSKLNLRIVVGPRRFGYEGLHHYEGLLFDHMAAASRMAFIFADDCIITRGHFDRDLLDVDRRHKSDNIYFVHTNSSNRGPVLGDTAEEPLRLLWMLQAHGPHSHFPVVSKGVIRCAREALEALPAGERRRWSPLANAWRSDCYLDVLSTYVKAAGADRIHVLPMITVGYANVPAPHQNTPDRFGLSASNRAFVTLLATGTQDHLKAVAGQVAERVARTDASYEVLFDGSTRLHVTYPSENERLTPEEYDRCCSLIDHYRGEKGRLGQYCLDRGREPAMYDRGGVWQEGFADFLPRMIESKNYNNINFMRLIGWQFSAFRLIDLSWVTEPAPNEWFASFYRNGLSEIPEDIDHIIKSSVNVDRKFGGITRRLDDLIDGVDNKYLSGQPMRFGEIAASYRGFMVNGDSQRYWGTMAVLYRAGILAHLEAKIRENGVCRVAEIGPGYGGLAYQLKRAFADRLQFIAIDLVESLLFSSCYMTTVLQGEALFYQGEPDVSPDVGLVFVPSFRSPEFFGATPKIDLFINTISMNEMSIDQVDYYGGMISATMADDGLFVECNWNPELGGPNRIDVKRCLAPHFKQRIDLESTEMSTDGNLSLWSNAIPVAIVDAVAAEYGLWESIRGRDLPSLPANPVLVTTADQAA